MLNKIIIFDVLLSYQFACEWSDDIFRSEFYEVKSVKRKLLRIKWIIIFMSWKFLNLLKMLIPNFNYKLLWNNNKLKFLMTFYHIRPSCQDNSCRYIISEHDFAQIICFQTHAHKIKKLVPSFLTQCEWIVYFCYSEYNL